MTALLLAVGLFAGWSLIGLALLALLRCDTTELRVLLTAPALGSCLTLLVIFPFSEAGVAVGDCAVPIAIFLLAASVVIVAWRRPRMHPAGLAVAGICVGGLLLAAWPMFNLGFGWFANGNDDMANYVLSSQGLLHHGVLSFFDLKGLAQGRDYATVINGYHLTGARPGTDILLAAVSRVAGRPPYETFMPTILAFNLCGASAVGALAMQLARRARAAIVASALLVLSPLATYGVLQQLLPQVFGLGVAAALLALLMRPELHQGSGARVRDVVPIGVLAAGLVLGYLELVPTIGLAYVVYVVVLGVRRQLGVNALLRLWLPAVAIVLIVLNGYLFREVAYLSSQSKVGLSNPAGPPLFGFILVPSGLPGVVGLQTLPPGFEAPLLDLTIILAAVMILGALVGSVLGTRRGMAAAIVLLVEAGLGTLLALKSTDFGLFKLAMYVQPFLAAAVAVWWSGISRRWLHALVAVLLVALAVADLSTQRKYVTASKDPGEVPHLSAKDVIPAFHSLVATQPGPIVSVTENPVLIKLEAASADGRPVYFQSRNVFAPFFSQYTSEVGGARRAQVLSALRSGPWVSRDFQMLNGTHGDDSFEEDTNASRGLLAQDCELVLPGTGEVPFNRYSLPPASPSLTAMRCKSAHNLLAFITSNLGQSFYLPSERRFVSFFQFQPDPFFTGAMAGFGRYALFQVLGPSSGERMAVELTTTLNHQASDRLPPAAVVGSSRTPLPLTGNGSARVFSSPIKPQVIDGTPYVLLDMGLDGRLPTIPRSGIQDLYGGSVPTDPNYTTSFVRDISMVSAAQYASLRPPLALRRFPADLTNPDLEYSGLYEDGWMGAEGYVRLAAGPAADLLVKGEVPAGAGKHLEVLVNKRRVASRTIVPGPLDVRVALPASRSDRRIELRFAATIKLAEPDGRPAAARLKFLGLVPRAAQH
jgi:hypothetical protein